MYGADSRRQFTAVQAPATGACWLLPDHAVTHQTHGQCLGFSEFRVWKFLVSIFLSSSCYHMHSDLFAYVLILQVVNGKVMRHEDL